MIDLGTVKPGSTLRIPFSSFDKDDGSSITMTNYAAADILVYKDGSTTERASTAGFTATTDFDGKTGKHLAIIDLADNTTADFFAAGSEYHVAIDAVTVDTVTTGGWIARFRIGYPTAVLDTTIATLSTQTSFTLTAGPAEDDALNDYWAIIHDAASAVQCSWVEVLDYTGSTKTVTLAAGATFTAAAKDNISFIGPSPLRATTMGRKLDVSAGGEAGVDWANIGSPTTTVNLSGTTVKTATDVETDTQDIQGRLPAALTAGGNIKADTLAISGDATAADNLEAALDGTGGVTITAAVTGNITGNLSGSVGSVTGAVGSVTGGVGGNVTGSVGSIASGGIAAASFAVGAIDAAAIAANAIGASELAADAVTEIRSLASGTADSGTTTTMVDAARTEADTDYWDENHLIVFTSGNIAGQARVITGFDPATDTITFTPATTQAVGTNTYEIWPVVSALRPTVHGRTLDVSAGGEAGVDWANVGSPTTTVNLSGTTVKTATDVETDTADIQSRLPAALTAGGNMKSDALAISGDTVAADNAESFFDGTGYAGTNNVIPTVTTLTGHTPQTGDTYALANGANGFVALKSDTAAILDDTGTNGVVVASASKTGYRLSATGAGDILTTALTESYAADGAAPTLSQAVFAIQQMLQERSISSTTLTVKKLDGTTSAMTFTLDSASSPTSITRAT